jgi:hypothetical protein
VKTADAALRSLDRIFNGHDPKKLSVAFRKAMPTLSAGEAETKTKSGAKAREKYFRAADAVFDWKLPLRPIELVTYLCFVRHARGSDGRVERLSGEQIARECGMKNERHARRIIAFLVKAGMIKKTFIGGWKGSVKTNEYLVPWLPETFTRELLTAAIKRARKALPGANPVKTKRRGKPSRKATASDADW